MTENHFQFFKFQWRGDTEQAFVSIKATVRHQDVTVGIEAKEIAEGLNGDDRDARQWGRVIASCSLGYVTYGRETRRLPDGMQAR